MRFRGKLVDTACIQHFSRVLGTIAKLCKTCVLRITADKLYFILLEKVVSGGTHTWCEVTQSHFFDEFMLDGLSKEDNEIFLELVPENLLRAMKTAQVAKWIKIKLTKKHTPCLTVEVDLPTITGLSRNVVHDISVTVLPKRLWSDYEEPEMPEFDVSIALPALKLLRNVVDKMKSMSSYVIISANHDGEMKLLIETEIASVCTYFKELANPTWKSGLDVHFFRSTHRSNVDKREFFEVKVDLKKFSQFLNVQQLCPSRVICNLNANHLIHVTLLHDDFSLQYFMPAVVS